MLVRKLLNQHLKNYILMLGATLTEIISWRMFIVNKEVKMKVQKVLKFKGFSSAGLMMKNRVIMSWKRIEK